MMEKKSSWSTLPSSLSNEHEKSEPHRHFIPESSPMRSIISSRSKTTKIPSPIRSSTTSTRRTTTNDETQRSNSKIPVRTNSSSKSRSRSPGPTRQISSKIPLPVSTSTSQGAFRFFTADDRPSPVSEQIPSTDSSHLPSSPMKQFSPFTPIDHKKRGVPPTSSAGNTPVAKHRHTVRESSDDDDDSETKNLEESDLKLKLKQQKRHGKETGQLLNQLHENYNELLEKYAQAENTIDQLRFQPKFIGDNSPPAQATEGTIHFIQQPSMNTTTARSSSIYQSTTGTPISSIVPRPSTTTTTSARKSTSPANSGTIESVVFDEPVPQTITVHELTTPETLKLDILLQTKSLSDKMKSFLTLMDVNQLSLAEQKQVYESIKEDYEKLLKVADQKKHIHDRPDIDFDADLNGELETMKQLLKEIVKRITDNLLGKSSNSSETGQRSHLVRKDSHSSQVSVRSSLCNHADLMDQYKKLLTAVNTEIVDTKKSAYTGSRTSKTPTTRDSSPAEISDRRSTTSTSRKPNAYRFGNSDDEQLRSHDTLSGPFVKDNQSSSFSLDYIPSNVTRNHQQLDEDQYHTLALTRATKKKKSTSPSDFQGYDDLENLTKTKRKNPADAKKYIHDDQREQEMSPASFSIPTGQARSSAASMRTRTSDYDSGFGTHNTTKLSRDSKLNTDESHYQSLDEDQRERRRYSEDDEQDLMSSASSSRSSGSGAASPRDPSNKYTKRFNNSSPLKPHKEIYRRKPSGNSDGYPSDIETHITGSFDPIPPPPSSSLATYQPRKTRRHHHSWQPHRTNSCHSRLTSHHRSVSIESLDNKNTHRPQTAPSISSKVTGQHQMGRKYQSGLIHRPTTSSKHADRMYQSSFYVDEAHTHRRSQEAINQRSYYERLQTPRKKQTCLPPNHHLYLDPQTGVVYRYESNKNPTPCRTYQTPISPVKSSEEMYRCAQCGSITTSHHRHHIHPTLRRVTPDFDDPGYESGNKKNKQRRLRVEPVSSSDSESDETSTSLDMIMLNEAYERAKKAQHRSQNLSRHISRQLKLVLATM